MRRIELFPGLIDLVYTVAFNQLAHIRFLLGLQQVLQQVWA